LEHISAKGQPTFLKNNKFNSLNMFQPVCLVRLLDNYWIIY